MRVSELREIGRGRGWLSGPTSPTWDASLRVALPLQENG
jgi:hypothetical protein